MKIIIRGKTLFLIICGFANLFIGIFIWSDFNLPYYYKMLPLLPIVQGLLCLFLIPASGRLLDDVSKYIVFIMYTLRNSVTPLFMSLGNYKGYLLIRSESSVNTAIALMIYEAVAVFILMIFIRNDIEIPRKRQIESIPIIKVVIMMLVIVCVFTIVRIPQIKELYSSAFDPATTIHIADYVDDSKVPVSGINRILYTLTQFIVQFVRILISIWLICLIKKKFGQKLIALIFVFMIFYIQLLFVPAQAAYILYILILMTIITIKLFPKYKIRIYLFIFTVGIMYIFTIAVAKSGNSSNPYDAISLMLQAYIPGVCNVAGIDSINLNSKLSQLFFDFYYMIPFRNTIFGLDGNNLAQIFNISNNVSGQILPGIAQTYYYLGFALSPLVSVLITKFGINASRYAKNEENIWQYSVYILMMLYCTTMPVVKNWTLFGATFFALIMPLLLICKVKENNYSFNKLL